MAGDEIVAEWLGDVYSKNHTTSSVTVNKFYSTSSRRFKCFHIYNPHNSYGVYIGQYYSLLSAFTARAVYLRGYQNMKLEFVDINTLAYADAGANVTLKVLGINEY